MAALKNYRSDFGMAPYGIRHSGEGFKGKGYFGELPSKDGMVSTEISTESDIGEHPLLVPTLTRKEIQHLLSGEEPTEDIYRKAEEHAIKREKSGKSKFASPTELRYPLPPEDEGSFKLYKKGGKVSSASKRGDGIAIKGRTKGRFV